MKPDSDHIAQEYAHQYARIAEGYIKRGEPRSSFVSGKGGLIIEVDLAALFIGTLAGEIRRIYGDMAAAEVFQKIASLDSHVLGLDVRGMLLRSVDAFDLSADVRAWFEKGEKDDMRWLSKAVAKRNADA